MRSLSLLALSCLLLGGCALIGSQTDNDELRPVVPTLDRETTAAVMLANTIQTLQRLAQGAPTEQAEILSGARAAYERAPFSSAQLRYALVLATPGHPGRDPERAQTLLRELAAQPESLQPAQRALALVELAQLERESGLKVENDRLQTELQKNERDRNTAAARRLQAEIDENAKLRRELQEAQAKLEAIANIERNISERNKPEVKKP